MNRKIFIESCGATCNNWRNSWSFVNEKDKVVIFGAWDNQSNKKTALILNTKWQISSKGRKQAAYKQSREHIRLIEEEDYTLKVFPILHSNAYKDEDGIGPAKIKKFIPDLITKSLTYSKGGWYATTDELIKRDQTEDELSKKYIEGSLKTIFVNVYERNSEARELCLKHYGYKCKACSFDFEKSYGSIGRNFIHVHHIVPLSEIKKKYNLDPIKDLIPICPNCHAIIHRKKKTLTIKQVKNLLNKKT